MAEQFMGTTDKMAADLIVATRAIGITPARVGSAVQFTMIAKAMQAMGWVHILDHVCVEPGPSTGGCTSVEV